MENICVQIMERLIRIFTLISFYRKDNFLGVEIEWKTEGLARSNPTYYIFHKIFDKFKLPDPVEAEPLPTPVQENIVTKGLLFVRL